MRNTNRNGTKLATSLGWFSIGLGAAELAAPGALARLVGAYDTPGVRSTLRGFGARGLAAGVAILAGPRRPLPLWNRVVGDVIDLAALGLAMRARRCNRTRLTTAMASMLGVTIVDVIAAARASRARTAASKPVLASITINRPPSDVYAAWRDFEQLPRYMDYLESVRDLGGGLSHWIAKLPTGGTVEWSAVTIEDRPAQQISWRAVEGSRIPMRGTITFEPTLDGLGTEVQIQMQYDAVGGRRLGEMVARLASKMQVAADLRRFKQVLEAGEILHGMHATPSEQPRATRG